MGKQDSQSKKKYYYTGIQIWWFKKIDFTEFSSALKSSWIRRMIFTDTKWINLLEAELQAKIKNLWVKGTNFLSNICKNTNNIFWKEVFNSWILVVNATRQEITKVSLENIWLNPKIKVNNDSFFLKHYFNAGFMHIQDLFDNEGVFLSLSTIENRNVKTNFIEYASLKRAIFE